MVVPLSRSPQHHSSSGVNAQTQLGTWGITGVTDIASGAPKAATAMNCFGVGILIFWGTPIPSFVEVGTKPSSPGRARLSACIRPDNRGQLRQSRL